MKHRQAALVDAPVARTLFLFSLPILLGNVLQSLNGSVNAIWVGNFLGEAALTATANANTILFLLIGGAFGVSMAATILVGQHLGAQRLQDAKRVVGTSATFFTAVSLVLAVAGVLATDPLLHWMRTPADAIAPAEAYLRLLFLSVPFLYLFTFLMAVLRGAGDAKTPFAFLVLAVVLDIVLVPLLMFGPGPLPALGIAGSSLATVIANAVSLAALLVHLYRRRNPLVLRGPELAYLRLDGAIVRTLVAKGLPMGLQMIVIAASGVVMITLVNRFGTDSTAAYGAAWQIWTYVQMPAMAIGAAVSAMAAQNVGAQRWDRVGRVAKVGVAFSVAVTGSLVGLIYLVNRPALALFLPPGAALEIAVHVNLIGAWSFVLFGIPMVLFGVVRATGAVMAPLAILFVALWLVRWPLAEAGLPYWGADAIWWSFPISSAAAALLALAYYRWGGWRKARMTREAPPPVPEPAG